MKNQIIIILVLCLISCQKVIKLDLNEGNPRYVMEGNLIAGEPDFILKISKTTSYFNPKTPEPVNNATVVLFDNNVPKTLTFIQDGIYQLTGANAQIGNLYTLKVEVDGNTFEAKANIPDSVPIVDLIYVDDEVSLSYNDPSGKKNYYRIRQYKNTFNPLDISEFILDDFGTDGTLITENLFFGRGDDEGNGINSGDTIHAELQSINEKTYTFLNTLDAAISGGGSGPGSTSPANPITNWTNNGLGYFGGGSQSIRTIVIP
jgi:hypothetical protein